jgi:hypothetical protein
MLRLVLVIIALTSTCVPTITQAAGKTYFWEPSSSRAFPRVAWCADHSRQCGQAAANQYCERQGFDRASSFAKDLSPQSLDGDPHLVGDPNKGGVYLIRHTCNADYCKTFAAITCVNGVKARPVRRRGVHHSRLLYVKKHGF